MMNPFVVGRRTTVAPNLMVQQHTLRIARGVQIREQTSEKKKKKRKLNVDVLILLETEGRKQSVGNGVRNGRSITKNASASR